MLMDVKFFENNTNPWNVRANMLYLEQPAGVGYSIAADEEAFHHNDFTQSLDTLEAVK